MHSEQAGGQTTAPDGRRPKRRAHPKSRTGCRTCKQRRIRCDERRPVCASLHVLAETPADPFDCLPIPMVGRMAEDFRETIRDHQTLCAILPNLKKTGSSAGDLGLANANASWFRYALFNNLRTHLFVLRRGNQPISRALEQTFAAHQLAVIQTIRGEVEKGAFTFTGLGIGVGWTLCCSAAGYEAEANMHLDNLFTIIRLPAQSSMPHFDEWMKTSLALYLAGQSFQWIAQYENAGSGQPTWTADNADVVCDHPSHQRALSNRLVSCFMWQLMAVFSGSVPINGHLQFAGRGDAVAIRWLHGRLKRMQSRGGVINTTAEDTERRRGSRHVSDETCLELAIMAWTLGIVKLFPTPEPSAKDQSGDAHPLAVIKARIARLMQEWFSVGPLVTNKIVRGYVSLMMWFESHEGIAALRFLADTLERGPTDGTDGSDSRAGLDSQASKAPWKAKFSARPE